MVGLGLMLNLAESLNRQRQRYRRLMHRVAALRRVTRQVALRATWPSVYPILMTLTRGRAERTVVSMPRMLTTPQN